MPISTNPLEITITAGGGEETLTMDNANKAIIVSGSATLGADFTIAPPDSAATGTLFEFYYFAEIDVDSYDLNIFGTILTDEQALYPCKISAYKTASAWKVIIHSNIAAPTGIYQISDDIRLKDTGTTVELQKLVSGIWTMFQSFAY